MRFYKLLVLVLLIFPTVANAQKGYSSGYVVDLKGDTLLGKVKLPSFADMREIKFINAGGKKTKYTPSQLMAMKSGFQHFKSIQLDSLGLDKDEFKNDGNVFAQILEQGEISLYKIGYCIKYKINSGRGKGNMSKCFNIYYLQRPYQHYFEAYKNIEGGGKITKDKPKNSIAQLAGYFEDHMELSKKILYEQYTRPKIGHIVREYNSWYLNKE